MAEKAGRPNRGSVCLPGLVSLAFALACAPDLPNDQLLTSSHFRYHARAEAKLDPTIMDRLEMHRAEFDTSFGIESPLVDYYLYQDDQDLSANSPCSGRDCTSGHSIFTTSPFQEHELVHGLLSGVGRPALIIGEGIAQHAACIQTHLAAQVPPTSWAEVAGRGNDSSDVYNFGQRLTAWMLAAREPGAFISFYGKSLQARDPALFALQFESFWGRRIADVAGELNDDRYEGSACPCVAPPVPDDGSPVSFVARQDYRTFDVPSESRVLLASSGPLVYPASCTNAVDYAADVIPPAPVASTIARVGAGRFGVLAWHGADETPVTIHRSQQPQSDWSCEAAIKAPMAAGAGDVALWVTPDKASSQFGTWFAVNIDGPRVLSMLSNQGFATACTSCEKCGNEGLMFPGDVIPSGIVVVNLIRALASDHTSIGALLSRSTP